jgi:hypothetical protein
MLQNFCFRLKARGFLGFSIIKVRRKLPMLHFTSLSQKMCELLGSPGIDAKESIPLAYVAWRAGTSKFPAHQAGNRFLGSLKDLQNRALD